MPRRGLDQASVVAAAAAIADSDGLSAVTVARVAGDLGIRAPSIYAHVAGRDGLLRGIALLGVREFTECLRDAAVGRSGEQAVRAVAVAYRDYAHRHPGRYEAIQRAPADPEAAEAAADAVGVLAGILVAWRLTEDDAVHAVRTLRSALHGFVELERIGGFAIELPLDASFERLVTGLSSALDSFRR